VRTVIEELKPDIVALQDCPERFNPQGIWAGDWHVQTRGQFLIASRYPLRDKELASPKEPEDAVVRAILKPNDSLTIRLYSLHLESPRDALVAIRQRGFGGGEALEANSKTRRTQSAVIEGWIGKEQGPLLIVGDFNTPPESTIYGAFWSNYTNAFTEAGLGWGYTYNASRTALRIDHILAGPGWRCRECWVGAEVGSEHRPVIADLEWIGVGK
jgi:endonuclease/exonuclease/phosphatase family metal-dependent hydrolase